MHSVTAKGCAYLAVASTIKGSHGPDRVRVANRKPLTALTTTGGTSPEGCQPAWRMCSEGGICTWLMPAKYVLQQRTHPSYHGASHQPSNW